MVKGSTSSSMTPLCISGVKINIMITKDRETSEKPGSMELISKGSWRLTVVRGTNLAGKRFIFMITLVSRNPIPLWLRATINNDTTDGFALFDQPLASHHYCPIVSPLAWTVLTNFMTDNQQEHSSTFNMRQRSKEQTTCRDKFLKRLLKLAKDNKISMFENYTDQEITTKIREHYRSQISWKQKQQKKSSDQGRP